MFPVHRSDVDQVRFLVCPVNAVPSCSSHASWTSFTRESQNEGMMNRVSLMLQTRSHSALMILSLTYSLVNWNYWSRSSRISRKSSTLARVRQRRAGHPLAPGSSSQTCQKPAMLRADRWHRRYPKRLRPHLSRRRWLLHLLK